MKLVPIGLVPAALELLGAGGDMHAEQAGGGHEAGSIEWEDTMEDVNRQTTTADMRWMLVDRQTGKANAAIDWSFRVGDRVKIRLVNEMGSDHPMHHPFHIHGAGRFLVLSRDGAPEPNLVWRDTVLVKIPSGATARNRRDGGGHLRLLLARLPRRLVADPAAYVT